MESLTRLYTLSIGYNQVSDLRTAFVAAAGMASFDGWITALDEVANVSQYPKNFFGKTTFLGASGLSVARAVLERDADVGILRVCELETLTAAGLVEPGSLRVVGEKPQQGLACVSSTELFPGLALAAQTYVPEDVRRRIAAAVYSMPVPESGYRWTLANDYRNVRRVAEKFAYAPTNKASDARFSVVEERYKYALVLGFLILAASMLYSVSVSKIVARRTKALVKVIDEKDVLEDNARRDRERLSQLERAGIVSELSSMIAHELRQPSLRSSTTPTDFRSISAARGTTLSLMKRPARSGVRPSASRASSSVCATMPDRRRACSARSTSASS